MEGLKYDQEKPPMELLDAYALEELTKVLAFGKKKYAAENWRQGINTTRLLGAALRHIFAFLRGEDNDPESGLSHIAHAMCCCMFILWMTKERSDMDDRRTVKAVRSTVGNAQQQDEWLRSKGLPTTREIIGG